MPGPGTVIEVQLPLGMWLDVLSALDRMRGISSQYEEVARRIREQIGLQQEEEEES